ncbi:MAG TPA: hypothetical protein VGQ47_00285 [Candidatus Limnocylindrales bacterium]|jgi:hypothetical protein|nr:hypothetical protein [Candidatus Limnocylindrales bacterium]
MIRNVVIHLQGEQPLSADIRGLPTAQDACLVCTNVRTKAGQKPIFIDDTDSWFLFPLLHIRFIEIPAEAVRAAAQGGEDEEAAAASAMTEDDLELDEDFLRRVREA